MKIFILLYFLCLFSSANQKNIIFFITEDQSYHLGHFGTKGLETPNIDQFCEDSYVFERGFVLSPVCSPSKMAVLSGTFPHTSSAVRNVPNYGINFPLKNKDPSKLFRGGIHEDLPTLIEILNANKVYTALTSKSHTQPVRKFPWAKGYGRDLNGTRYPEAAPRILKQVVKDAGEKPFFLWYNVAAPHLPFNVQLQQNKLWDPNGGLTGDGGATNVDANEIEVPPFYPDTPAVRQDMADYYGNIESIDTIFGKLVQSLKDQGIYEDTLIIYTSDHGIGLHRAKQSVYGAGTHVPFIIGGGAAQAGTTKQPVSHLDVAPTVLSYWDITVPETMVGKSLLPVISGEKEELAGRTTMLCAGHEHYDGRAVTDGRYYYIENIRKPKFKNNLSSVLNTDQFTAGKPWFNRTYGSVLANKDQFPKQHLFLQQLIDQAELPDVELYDMQNDFWMVNNIATANNSKPIINRLRKELIQWRIKTQDYNYSSKKEAPVKSRRTNPENMPLLSLVGSEVFSESFENPNRFNDQKVWNSKNSGYSVKNQFLRSSAGNLKYAIAEKALVQSGSDFKVSVEIGFNKASVAAGLIIEHDDKTFHQILLKDGKSSLLGKGRDITIQFINEEGKANTIFYRDFMEDYQRTNSNSLYKVSFIGKEGSPLINLRVYRPDGSLYCKQDGIKLRKPIKTGAKIGITSVSSAHAVFDNFSFSAK